MTYIEKPVAWNQLQNTVDSYLLTDRVVRPSLCLVEIHFLPPTNKVIEFFSRVCPSVSRVFHSLYKVGRNGNIGIKIFKNTKNTCCCENH